MNLKTLLNGIQYHVIYGRKNKLIQNLCSNSKKVQSGDVLFLLSECCYHDSSYVREACIGNVSAIIMEKGKCDTILFSQIYYICKQWHVTLITVPQIIAAFAHAAAAFYQYPENRLLLIGITGTKGKTTTAHFLYHILNENGIRCGTIGTCGAIWQEHQIDLLNTTPDAVTLRGIFHQMVEDGCRAVVMEVSSQALKKGRTQGLEFEYGVFTNISHDHISTSEHSSMEEYVESKALLFRQCRHALVNADDEYAVFMVQNLQIPVSSYSMSHNMSQNADLYVTEMKQNMIDTGMQTEFTTDGTVAGNFDLRIPGSFNVANALPAIWIAKDLQIVQEGIHRTLSHVMVPGRMECYRMKSGALVVIDYAHNADSLDKLLTSLREYHPSRLICVFGCGGNRAIARRTLMGEISARKSDFTIITSDNPRDEEPLKIMQDIEAGVKNNQGEYILIEDRREAIYHALNLGTTDDMIVIAGKGHEDYQEIKGVRYPMSDKRIVEDYDEQEICKHNRGDFNR